MDERKGILQLQLPQTGGGKGAVRARALTHTHTPYASGERWAFLLSLFSVANVREVSREYKFDS